MNQQDLNMLMEEINKEIKPIFEEKLKENGVCFASEILPIVYERLGIKVDTIPPLWDDIGWLPDSNEIKS